MRNEIEVQSAVPLRDRILRLLERAGREGLGDGDLQEKLLPRMYTVEERDALRRELSKLRDENLIVERPENYSEDWGAFLGLSFRLRKFT